MKKNLLLLCVLAALFLVAAIYHPRPSHRADPTGFAVVELYTSEGCSSCPPADAIVAKMGATYKNVYVLGFHVDYWDRLGWKDAYSNADYTQRQINYGKIFKLNSIYTPQAVVNGTRQLVASDEHSLKTIIESDLKMAAGKAIQLQAVGGGQQVRVNYQVADGGADSLYIALVQSHAETMVKAGENDGRKLVHMNIVRAFRAAPAGNTGTMDLPLPAGLQAKDCKVIGFLQGNGGQGAVVTGAAEAMIQ